MLILYVSLIFLAGFVLGVLNTKDYYYKKGYHAYMKKKIKEKLGDYEPSVISDEKAMDILFGDTPVERMGDLC